MKPKYSMSISEFAGLSGIKRANLIFYDKIGLLKPESRGDNEYRYYTKRQLGTAYLITSLRELGIGLEEIKKYADCRTPERMAQLFQQQEVRISEEITKLKNMSEIMKLHVAEAERAALIDDDKIYVREQKREPIFLGKPLAAGMTEDDGMTEFYHFAAEQKIELGYPFGTIIPQKSLNQGIFIPSQCYLKINSRNNACKPAGTYAVTYSRGGYDELENMIRRLLLYIKDEGLTVCGSAYEETPLNEISIEDEQNYLLRVEIMVAAGGGQRPRESRG